MTTYKIENTNSNEISTLKEKILNTIFTKKELNRINDLLDSNNYIVDYLWNFLNSQVDQFVHKTKTSQNFKKEDIKQIFLEYTDLTNDYIKKFEYKDSQKNEECKKDFFIIIINKIDAFTADYYYLFFFIASSLNPEVAIV